MKKNIEWAKKEIKKIHALTFDAYEAAVIANNKHFQMKNSEQLALINKIMEILDQLDEPEVLSQEWIDEHTYHEDEYDFYYADPDELKNLLVPKQEEVDQAYKDGYEKGKEYASGKEAEETETVASVFLDYLIASAKLKLALGMEVEELEE